MNIIISGKQIELTDAIKNAIEEKLGRLDFYINPETEVRVTVSAKKARHTIEITIVPISGPIIRAESMQDDLYSAIDIAYDKLNRQLRRYKEKIQDKHQDNKSIRFEHIDDNIDEDDTIDIRIERQKKFSMKPMSAEEAVLQMELIEHDFYIFRNIESDEVCIVYKRNNKSYGLIETE